MLARSNLSCLPKKSVVQAMGDIRMMTLAPILQKVWRRSLFDLVKHKKLNFHMLQTGCRTGRQAAELFVVFHAIIDLVRRHDRVVFTIQTDIRAAVDRLPHAICFKLINTF